jgi:CheY-like chemotaxis protein
MTGLSLAQTAKLARCPVVVLSANRFTSQLVRSLFFGLGMQDIAVVANAALSLERFQLCRLDLVVADTGTATFDPIEPLSALRSMADQRQAALPVILLTTQGQAPDRSLANVHALRKPLSNREFKQVVLRLLLNIEIDRQEAGSARPEPSRATTLLLSGNPYTAQVVRALLLSLGLADLAVAGNPDDAEQKLAGARFDLVIADSGPASFDGLAMVEAIRRRPGGPLGGKPVLLLASNPSAALVERARSAQVKAIATKPLDPGAFGERVRRILSVKTA